MTLDGSAAAGGCGAPAETPERHASGSLADIGRDYARLELEQVRVGGFDVCAQLDSTACFAWKEATEPRQTPGMDELRQLGRRGPDPVRAS